MSVDLAQLYNRGDEIYPITSSEAITGIIPVSKGGSGANNASGARANFGFTFAPGDIYTVCASAINSIDNYYNSGTITNSGTQIYFTVVLPKSMENVTPTVTSLKENMRQWNNYVTKDAWVSGGTQLVGASGYTVTCAKINDYNLTIEITKSSRFKEAIVNNAPIAIQLAELIISFSQEVV